MKKIVPDPPHTFDLPPGKSLSRAISEGIVPIEFALMNVSHYLMFAYSDSRRALERIQEEETRQLLEHGLRAMQIAWGQAHEAEAYSNMIDNFASFGAYSVVSDSFDLHNAVAETLNDPTVKPKLLDLGFEIVANTPEQFTAFQAAEFARWKKLIETRNIKVE